MGNYPWDLWLCIRVKVAVLVPLGTLPQGLATKDFSTSSLSYCPSSSTTLAVLPDYPSQFSLGPPSWLSPSDYFPITLSHGGILSVQNLSLWLFHMNRDNPLSPNDESDLFVLLR